MDFNTAWNIVCTDLTPQPWDYTDTEGTTLRIIPAGLRETAGYAEVLIRITRADATGLGNYDITGPNSRGVAEIGITTTGLPALIEALTEGSPWWDADLVCGSVEVVPEESGVTVNVTEDHGNGIEIAVSVTLPAAQRVPLASALARALDVAKSWEDQ